VDVLLETEMDGISKSNPGRRSREGKQVRKSIEEPLQRGRKTPMRV